MKAYKITPNEKDSLTGSQMPDGGYYNPVKDINGDWFIFQSEHEASGLGTEAEYVPPITEEII